MPPTPAGNAKEHNAQNPAFAKSSHCHGKAETFESDADWGSVQSTMGCKMFPLDFVSTCVHQQKLRDLRHNVGPTNQSPMLFDTS
jgi:hypothetical protein